MIHKFSRVTYLNPSFSVRSRDLFNQSISLLELSWYRFHLKPSRRNVANCGVYQWSKFSPILSAREVFISSLISSKQLFSLVAEFHLKFWDVSISPRRSYPFFVDFSTTPFYPSFKDALSNSLKVEHVVFFSVLFIAFFHFYRRHCDVALFTHLLVL